MGKVAITLLAIVLVSCASATGSKKHRVEHTFVTHEMVTAFEKFQIERNITARQDADKYQTYVTVCTSPDGDDAIRIELAKSLFNEEKEWIGLKKTCQTEGARLQKVSSDSYRARVNAATFGCVSTCTELATLSRRFALQCVESILDHDLRSQFIGY